MWEGKRVAVVFPAYNEENYIAKAIDDFFASGNGVVDEIVAVDNNSRDATAERIQATRARYVRETRQGYGNALRRGMAEAATAGADLIVLAEPESDGGLPESGTPAAAAIEAVGLGFRYAEGEPWVLRDCNFRIGAGESVAIVGASGCGKTTLAKLLLGLLPATEGGIRWGGTGIRQVGSASYRKLVAAVMQDDHLFAGSIAIAGDASDSAQRRIRCPSGHARVIAVSVIAPAGYIETATQLLPVCTSSDGMASATTALTSSP